MCSTAIILAFVILSLSESLNVPSTEYEKFLENQRYENYDELTNLFRKLQAEHPDMVKLHTVGKSVKNRELWALEINSNVENRTILTPMFKYVANMHGDETLGRQLMIYLALYLIHNYGKNERVTKLVTETDIFLMPSMNPDGYENSEEGKCDSKDKYVGRENENSVDLNRDFPDQFEVARTGLTLGGRQPETVAMMTWIISRPFVLSGNLHGGAVVASYPFDDSSERRQCCKESKSPDNDLFKKLALLYAEPHPLMKTGNSCKFDNFDRGITNGAYWYEVTGGMQDFNYVHSNCFEVTFELSCCKFPPANMLPQEWYNNKESLLRFMEATHWGVKGLVRNERGDAVLDADVVVVGINHNVTTSNRGEYWRLLLPGTYEMFAVAYGFLRSELVNVVVVEGKTSIQHFNLKILPPDKDDSVVENSTETLYDRYGFMISDDTIFKHHHYQEMIDFMRYYNKMYPNITAVRTIGKSVQGRDLAVFIIGSTPNEHVLGKPEFKYVANMHGNEVVGKEMLLYLIKYLCERYGTDDRITSLLNSTRIHLLPSMNPDGYEISREGDDSSLIGRNNANDFDLNRNFPDQYGTNQYNSVIQPETRAVMDWVLSEPFVLSANLHNGALVANYPYDDTPTGQISENLSPDDKVFKYLAHTYANAHRTMHDGVPCPMFPREHFSGGITNGASWYVVTGGMQDWNYIVAGCLELTLEIGCFKYPYSKDLPQYWLDNKDALISYMEQVHKGVSGFVTSTIGTPLEHADVLVEGIKHSVRTGKNGDYWRILLPGQYNLTVAARGYESYTFSIIIPESGYLQHNITLMKDDPLHWASAYDFGIGDNQYKPKYHTSQEIYSILAGIENGYPDIASFQGGDDYVSMAIHSLKLSKEIESDDERKFHVAIIGNLFATQPIGREIGVYLARHLAEGYRFGDFRITKILNNTVIHIIPVIDKAFEQIWGDYDKEVLGNIKPDKFLCNNISADFKQVGDEIINLKGRISNHQDVKSTVNAFKHMLLDEKFDLVINIEGGSSGILYPSTKDQVQVYKQIAETYYSELKVHRSCSKQAAGTDELLTDFLYVEYFTPVLTVKVSCCEYPAIGNIPYIWRDVLEPVMRLLFSTSTGVEGIIQNSAGEPMLNATLRVLGVNRPYEVSKKIAHFKVMLPPGIYDLEISCHGYQNKVIQVNVVEDNLLFLKVVLIKESSGTPEVYKGTIVEIKPNEIVMTDTYIHTPFAGDIRTGMKGYVRDYSNHPVSKAKIIILERNITIYSDENGKYGVPLVPGKYTVKFGAYGYHPTVKLVDINAVNQFPKIVMVQLKRDTNFFGIPRLAFVLLTGFVCAGILGLSALCYMKCKKQNEYGLLSQHGYYEDFKDIDDSKEIDLFRTPLNKPIITRPYYDEDDDDENIDYPINRNFSSSEDEEIILIQAK